MEGINQILEFLRHLKINSKMNIIQPIKQYIINANPLMFILLMTIFSFLVFIPLYPLLHYLETFPLIENPIMNIDNLYVVLVLAVLFGPIVEHSYFNRAL